MAVYCRVASFLLVAILYTSPIRSGFVINVSEVGADVVANGSGTLNTTALSFIGLALTGASEASLNPVDGVLGIGATAPGNLDGYYNGITGPSSFGPGSGASTNSSTGDFVMFFQGLSSPVGGPLIVLPSGYAGTPLSSQALWQNQSFNTLGITAGTYVWSWGAGANTDTFTLNAISAVPEPTSVTLFGLACIGVFRLRKQVKGSLIEGLSL